MTSELALIELRFEAVRSRPVPPVPSVIGVPLVRVDRNTPVPLVLIVPPAKTR